MTSALSGLQIVARSSYQGSIYPTGAKIGWSYRKLREIKGDIIELVKQIQGKLGLVRDFGRLGETTVQEMGIPV